MHLANNGSEKGRLRSELHVADFRNPGPLIRQLTGIAVVFLIGAEHTEHTLRIIIILRLSNSPADGL